MVAYKPAAMSVDDAATQRRASNAPAPNFDDGITTRDAPMSESHSTSCGIEDGGACVCV